MLRINDLKIDVSCLGGKYWLTGVVPAYAYANGQRTDTISGHRYTVALPEKGLEKLAVRIDGPQTLSAPESGYVEVKFDNLELYFFWQQGQPQVGARATGISLVNHKG